MDWKQGRSALVVSIKILHHRTGSSHWVHIVRLTTDIVCRRGVELGRQDGRNLGVQKGLELGTSVACDILWFWCLRLGTMRWVLPWF